MQRRNSHSLRSIALSCAAAVAFGTAALGGTAPAHAAPGEITYTLHRSANPTTDEQDAYFRITEAMDRAVARYNTNSDITKELNVYYSTDVPTAEASNNGDLRFGSDRGFMVEGTALHEISHTIGVGQNGGFFTHCMNGTWDGPAATAVVRSFDGPGAQLSCDGAHIWPYGLNFSGEFSETAFTRHVDVMEAMLTDGM